MKSTSAATNRDEKSILSISSWAFFEIFSENNKNHCKYIENILSGAREQTCQHNSCNEIIDLFISRTQFIFDSLENRTIDKNRPSFDRRLKWGLKFFSFSRFWQSKTFAKISKNFQPDLKRFCFDLSSSIFNPSSSNSNLKL